MTKLRRRIAQLTQERDDQTTRALALQGLVDAHVHTCERPKACLWRYKAACTLLAHNMRESLSCRMPSPQLQHNHAQQPTPSA